MESDDRLTLEQQLELRKLELSLQAHPESAVRLALSLFRALMLQRNLYNEMLAHKWGIK